MVKRRGGCKKNYGQFLKGPGVRKGLSALIAASLLALGVQFIVAGATECEIGVESRSGAVV